MPLTAQAKAFLDEVAAKGSPPAYTLPPAEARLNRDVPLEPGPEVASAEDHAIPHPTGTIPVRVYTPHGNGPFPVLVWFHGGGWVIGSLESADGTCRRLTAGAACTVVSVAYRLAPEWKFPTAAEDSYAATVWVARNAPSINVDTSRLAVGGDSAGGNLATVVALMSRDRGGPPIVFQLLIYPVTDRNFSTNSYRENATGYRLTRDHMRWYWDHYLRTDADAANPYAAPLQAADLSGLPPALIITAEFDPLRDEGEAYAEGLRQAGVPTTCTRYAGVPHLFYMVPGRIAEARRAIDQSCAALKTAFGRQEERER
jgi:acetyl esterase